MNRPTKALIICSIPLITSILLLVSCNKSSDATGSQGQGLIQVSVGDATFEAEENLSNRAATPAEPTIQRHTIELNKDFLMVAELRPEDPASDSSLKDGTRAATDTSALGNNIRYRLLVYNQAGAFVAERDYIRGQEASTQALQLDGGSTYTFVAVSLNTTTDLPATTPAVATRTLANSRIATTTGINALMYYKQTLTVSGNSINRLDIVFKHRKPLIAVTINSQQTGYNITAAEGRINPHNDGMTVNLADGSHTLSGNETGVNIAFDNVGSQIITNTNTSFINSISNSVTSFSLLNLTIGSITATNLVPFTNLTVSPGVRYNLILNIVPNDQFLTHQGRPAARINGVIWARHNVGVDITLNPDESEVFVNVHGDYFQWGRLARSGTGISNTANPFFASNAPANNTWNSGTETVPIKTAADPCPTGYRIPTRREQEALIADTDWSNSGPFVTGDSRFDSAKILTSKRNSQVRLTLPAQGRFGVSGSVAPYADRGIAGRGSTGRYFSSYSTENPRTSSLDFLTQAPSIFSNGSNPSQKVVSTPIRCVGIQ